MRGLVCYQLVLEAFFHGFVFKVVFLTFGLLVFVCKVSFQSFSC